jgi:hypothetical protein
MAVAVVVTAVAGLLRQELLLLLRYLGTSSCGPGGAELHLQQVDLGDPSTAQHSTAQHSTAQHNTTQHPLLYHSTVSCTSATYNWDNA